jgi:aminoglycoside/choline kinase family phosphotransferase
MLLLQKWLKQQCGLVDYQLTRLAGDASFRVYFRLTTPQRSYVVMDASAEQKSCLPFVAIAQALRSLGLMTPEIIASDLTSGFLLLTDFGDQLYLKELNSDNAEKLYSVALDALSVLSTCEKVSGWTIPNFTAAFMRQEMEWFKQWFLVSYLALTEQEANTLDPFFDELTNDIAQQPYVFMHRDYHSANLMVLPSNQVGILDFQDAFYGPVTYDLASLLRDCYIAWPEPLVTQLALSYLQRLQEKHHLLQVNQAEFLRWFDYMSMQRHMKALMTFSRKYVRDQQVNYLQYIPQTLNYLLAVSERYPVSQCLNQFIKQHIMPVIATKELV